VVTDEVSFLPTEKAVYKPPLDGHVKPTIVVPTNDLICSKLKRRQ